MQKQQESNNKASTTKRANNEAQQKLKWKAKQETKATPVGDNQSKNKTSDQHPNQAPPEKVAAPSAL